MKEIGSNTDVARFWANRMKLIDGFTRNNTEKRQNFFRDRHDNLWSYGLHYCVGTILQGKWALINNQKYETTVADSTVTKRHREEARDAAKRAHLTVIEVPFLNPEMFYESAFDVAQERYIQAIDTELRDEITTILGQYKIRRVARTRAWDAHRMALKVKNYRAFCDWQGVPCPFGWDGKVDGKWWEWYEGSALIREEVEEVVKAVSEWQIIRDVTNLLAGQHVA